jgi:hypothetical protein
LCSFHHHRVHEGGFTLHFDGHRVTVARPDGTRLTAPPLGKSGARTTALLAGPLKP